MGSIVTSQHTVPGNGQFAPEVHSGVEPSGEPSTRLHVVPESQIRELTVQLENRLPRPMLQPIVTLDDVRAIATNRSTRVPTEEAYDARRRWGSECTPIRESGFRTRRVPPPCAHAASRAPGEAVAGTSAACHRARAVRSATRMTSASWRAILSRQLAPSGHCICWTSVGPFSGASCASYAPGASRTPCAPCRAGAPLRSGYGR